MIDVIEINIEDFEKDIYSEYIKLFPEDEQRSLSKLRNTFNKGVEKFYKIVLEKETIGFFLLEKLGDEYPFYLDYFAIYEEYQNKGYGTEAIKTLLNKIIKDNGLFAEVEKECEDDPNTIRRFEFYKRLGFRKTGSEYLLYNVYYNPIVYGEKKSKEGYDKLFFDYYVINSGADGVKNNCRIIK